MTKKILALTLIIPLVAILVVTSNVQAAGPDPRPVLCDDVEKVVSKYYPELKEGNTISKSGLISYIETRWVNYKNGKMGKFNAMDYVNRTGGWIHLLLPKKEALKCALIFSQPKANKVTYWGVDVLRTNANGRPFMPLGRTSNDYGAIMIVVQNDLSLTPYQVKY